MPIRATYFDGERPDRIAVEVFAEDGGLRIVREDGGEVRWPRGSFRLVSGGWRGEAGKLERGLEMLAGDDSALLEAIGRKPLALRRWAIGGGIAVIALLGSGYLWGVPWLARSVARRLPASWEEKLGKAASDGLAPPAKRCGD